MGRTAEAVHWDISHTSDLNDQQVRVADGSVKLVLCLSNVQPAIAETAVSCFQGLAGMR
jgi:hypothetical protein